MFEVDKDRIITGSFCKRYNLVAGDDFDSECLATLTKSLELRDWVFLWPYCAEAALVYVTDEVVLYHPACW